MPGGRRVCRRKGCRVEGVCEGGRDAGWQACVKEEGMPAGLSTLGAVGHVSRVLALAASVVEELLFRLTRARAW